MAWANYVKLIRSRMPWTIAQMATRTEMSEDWVKKALKGSDLNGDYVEKFERKLKEKWVEKHPDEPPLIFPAMSQPLAVSIQKEARKEHQPLDEKLVNDLSVGVGFSEWLGNPENREQSLRNLHNWLRAQPDDFYIRGMYLWSALVVGNPGQILGVLVETAQWLKSGTTVTSSSKAPVKPAAWRQTIDQLRDGTVVQPDFVRRHLEDTLVRATMLRFLRFQGKSSRLMKEFESLGRHLKQQLPWKTLLNMTESPNEDLWVDDAVDLATKWIGGVRQSGLAWLCWLWFIGRQGQPDHMKTAIRNHATGLNPTQINHS